MEQDFGPYLELARIQSEMNKLFDAVTEMRAGGPDSAASSWIPSVDVCRTEEGLYLRCDLPGVSQEGLRLTATGGALVIAGDRPRQHTEGRVKFTCVERTGGRFRRVIPLATSINTRGARATLRAGVLEVFFPNVSNRRGEEVVIPVQTAEGNQ